MSSKVWESDSFKFLSKLCMKIRVITKLPNSEQSYKGKVKTHKYINIQNQSTTGKLKTVMTLTWYRPFYVNNCSNENK